MRFAVGAHSSSATNLALAARGWNGVQGEVLTPREALLGQSVEPLSSTPQALAATMRADMARYAKLIKESGVRVEY